jgi:hypothetical protein
MGLEEDALNVMVDGGLAEVKIWFNFDTMLNYYVLISSTKSLS